jgi:hypothetical protein
MLRMIRRFGRHWLCHLQGQDKYSTDCKRTVHCHTAKPEPNRRVTIGRIAFLVVFYSKSGMFRPSAAIIRGYQYNTWLHFFLACKVTWQVWSDGTALEQSNMLKYLTVHYWLLNKIALKICHKCGMNILMLRFVCYIGLPITNLIEIRRQNMWTDRHDLCIMRFFLHFVQRWHMNIILSIVMGVEFLLLSE